MSNPIRWFEIYVQDMNRAKSFYESVFEIPLSKPGNSEGENDYWVFPSDDNYGASGALAKMDLAKKEGIPTGGNSTLVYFGCEDCAVEAKRAASHEGKIYKEKFAIGSHGFIALVFDTEGNLIGLHSMK